MGDVVQHVHAVQSTIQREMGVAVVNIGFATGGHLDVVLYILHPIRVNCGIKVQHN